MILDETHPLEEVMVWGEPGVEALLGQLLPQSRSLFRSYYEVPKARGEFACMSSLIESEGIKVTRAKDAVADLLKTREIPELPGSIQDLKRILHQKADSTFEHYRLAKQSDLIRDGITNISPLDVYNAVKRDIDVVLEEDIAQYGEQGALRLNYLLSLSKPWPMANIFYGRDQSQALTDRIILSSLRWNIRKPEVRIFKDALHHMGYGSVLADIREGTIEGGDVAMFKGYCFIGVGARTNINAVKEVYRQIGGSLKEHRIELIAVVNKQHEEDSNFFISPTSEHMQVMHLDMFWIPLTQDLVMAYTTELDHREVVHVWQEKGRILTERLGTFREFMSIIGVEIFEVDEAEQKNFATNLLNFGNKKVIAALSSNPRVNAELERRDFTVKYAELTKLVDGYGAVHCLTAPLKRRIPNS